MPEDGAGFKPESSPKVSRPQGIEYFAKSNDCQGCLGEGKGVGPLIMVYTS